jgi:hypothetical protein
LIGLSAAFWLLSESRLGSSEGGLESSVENPISRRQIKLELVHHVQIHFRDFAARGLADKVVSDDVRLRALLVLDVEQELIEPGVHALCGCRVFQDIAPGLLPVNPEQVIPHMGLVCLARCVRNLDRAFRRPVPLVLAFRSERCPQATGVLPAEREPGLDS